MPRACVRRLQEADLLLHCGDLSAIEALDMLEAIGPPVAAVHGNVDSPAVRDRLPERRVVEVDGLHIGMIHDAGPAKSP